MLVFLLQISSLLYLNWHRYSKILKIVRLTALFEENPDDSMSPHAADDVKPVRELLLNELTAKHQKRWELKKNLDEKAKSVITVAGIVTALIFSFSTFMARDDTNISTPLREHLDNSLTISILFIVSSIFIPAFSLKLQKYILPFSHANFYGQNKRIQ
jgi:hypothetical protein